MYPSPIYCLIVLWLPVSFDIVGMKKCSAGRIAALVGGAVHAEVVVLVKVTAPATVAAALVEVAAALEVVALVLESDAGSCLLIIGFLVTS